MSAEKHTCGANVRGSGWGSGHACGKGAKFQCASGWFCGTHAPHKITERRAAQNAEWERRMALRILESRKAADDAAETRHRVACYPELLAALQAVYAMDWRSGPVGDVYARAQAAIAKATGVIA